MLPVLAAGKTAVIIDDEDIPLVNSPRRLTPCSATSDGDKPERPVPNLWTVMGKWIDALPRTNMADKKRNALLQKELDRSVAELSELPGIGENGVRHNGSAGTVTLRY